MISFSLLLLLCIITQGVNGAFDYRMFHPNFRGTYDLTESKKPTNFAYYEETDTLYHITESNNLHVNGTITEGSMLEKIRQFTHGIFYTIALPEGVNPFLYMAYGYYSVEDGIYNSIGGIPGTFNDVIYNKYAAYSMPIIAGGDCRFVNQPPSLPSFDHRKGFHTYIEVPHEHGTNQFTTVDDAVVNNYGICARTTDGKYVCTGVDYVTEQWDLVHENFIAGNEDLAACATDDHIFILKNGNITVIGNNIMTSIPTRYSNEDITAIQCTANRLVAHTTSNKVYTLDTDHNELTIDNVESFQVNRNQLIVKFLAEPAGSFRLIDFVNPDYDFVNELFEGIVMTDVSTFITNGTDMAAFNPHATPTSIYVSDAEVIHSCADGLIMYLSNNSWTIYSHGDVSDLQTLLDERVLLDVSTTDHYGCMLVKLTDSHTGKDYVVPDYGAQADNDDSYEFAVFEDQTSDIVLLVVSTIALAVTIAGMGVYFLKIR